MQLTSIADQIPTLLAYLDPGSGSLMLQLLIAGMLSGLFMVKSYYAMIRESATRLFKRNA